MLKTKPIQDQIAIITGGGTGIGRAFAEALSSAGATVVIASRREEMLRKSASEINEQVDEERVFPYQLDMRDAAQIDSVVNAVIERWRAVDVLINNSGLAVPETVDQITEAGWDKVLETNLRGVMQLTRSVLPHMTRNDFGDIVNVSSQAGKHGYADVPSYCAAKFGLLGYAESLRDHVRKTGANIRVFNFCPGLVDVENTSAKAETKSGFIHVRNMARTLLYALSLDRNVVLEDVNMYAR